MNKSLVRFVALTIIPALLMDPAFAQGMHFAVHTNIPLATVGSKSFETNALSEPFVCTTRKILPTGALVGALATQAHALVFQSPALDQFTYGWKAIGIMASIIVGMVVGFWYFGFRRPPLKPDQMPEARAARAKDWASRIFSSYETEIALSKYTTEELMWVHENVADAALKVGLLPSLQLTRAVSKERFGLRIYFKRVLPELRKADYDLSDPDTFLNKNIILKGVQLASDAMEEREMEMKHVFGQSDINYLKSVAKEAQASDVLPGAVGKDMPKPSFLLHMHDIYWLIMHIETQLRRSATRWDIERTRGDEVPHHVLELSQKLRDLDKEFTGLMRQLPVDEQIGLIDNSGQRNRFPLRGSVDSVDRAHYVEVSDSMIRLLGYLSVDDGFLGGAVDGTILFGSDLEGVPWGAVEHAGRSYRSPWLIISGGPGRYLPKGWKTEADGFMKLINAWGSDWNKPRMEIEMEKTSDSIQSHAEASVVMALQRLHSFPVGKTPKILFMQAPAMQMRGVQALRYAFLRHGMNVKVVSYPPFFRGLTTPPVGWNVNQWYQRVAWDTVRELAKIIGGYRSEGYIDPNFRIPINRLDDGLRVAARLATDPSLPQADRERALNFQKTLEDELARALVENPKAPRNGFRAHGLQSAYRPYYEQAGRVEKIWIELKAAVTEEYHTWILGKPWLLYHREAILAQDTQEWVNRRTNPDLHHDLMVNLWETIGLPVRNFATDFRVFGGLGRWGQFAAAVPAHFFLSSIRPRWTNFKTRQFLEQSA